MLKPFLQKFDLWDIHFCIVVTWSKNGANNVVQFSCLPLRNKNSKPWHTAGVKNMTVPTKSNPRDLIRSDLEAGKEGIS